MKWNFRRGGNTESPQNAAIKEFSKHIFESIVREAIQNSLDNSSNTVDPANDKTPSVTVKFEFTKIAKNQIPGYDDLLNHYNSTKLFWQNDPSYRPIFDAIDTRLQNFVDNIPYLKISDDNTTGMNITPKQNESIRLTSYYAFTRGNNTVKSNAQAGGSEGQGKATFYAASALRTLFIHTKSKYGSIYEGLTRLATHTIDNQDYSSNGHLFQDIDTPTYEESKDSSLPFRRDSDSFGSTISILGLWAYDDVEQKMIKSAINNFWMAISEGDLIVQVGDVILKENNIENLIETYLPERNESSHTKSDPTKNGRAKCYYETWTGKQLEHGAAKQLELQETYSKEIDTLGQCTLKISQHPEYPGKIAFFRKQKMLIVRSPVNSFITKGYCGVFICTSDEGNQILRKMEGKTHTEWDPKWCMTEADTQLGIRAMEAINRFITESWQSYRSKHFPDTIELRGLAGLSIGNNTSGKKKSTSTKDKPSKTPHSDLKPKPEFEKLGITKKGLRSVKENGMWKYLLLLKTNEVKRINIRMYPATDAAKVSNDDLIKVLHVSDGWSINNNEIEGGLVKGENTIEFVLKDSERVALDFKLTNL
jgi:hypothetical protein